MRMWRSWQRATLPRWRSPVRGRSSAPCRSSPTWQRRFPQKEEVPGSNPGCGTGHATSWWFRGSLQSGKHYKAVCPSG
jgi:hypothetical protein